MDPSSHVKAIAFLLNALLAYQMSSRSPLAHRRVVEIASMTPRTNSPITKARRAVPRTPTPPLLRATGRRFLLVDGTRPIGLTEDEEAELLALKARGSFVSECYTRGDENDDESEAGEASWKSRRSLADRTSCASLAELAEEPDEDTCPVCFEEMGKCGPCQWPACCGHAFCKGCADSCLRRNVHCPLCRAEAPSETQKEAQKAAMYDAMTSMDLSNLTDGEKGRLRLLLALRFAEQGESTPVRASRMRVVRRMASGPRSPARRSGRGLMASLVQGFDEVAETMFG